MWASGQYSASLSVSTSTPWRWLNVPRRVSWPARRTGVPSSSERPERERLGERPVDLVGVELGAARAEDPLELGVDVEVVGRA